MKALREKGVSLRKIHLILVVVMSVMTVIVGYATYRLSVSFHGLAKAADEHNELAKAAHELMDASDYLTENVQRFTACGDRKFMDQYFEEALEANRREEALEKMSQDDKTQEAYVELEAAMDSSLELMEREYYAMRLVIEAKNITDYPDVLDGVELSAADAALSSDDKMRLATTMVLDDEYYQMKDRIRVNMKECVDILDRLMEDTEASEMSELRGGVRVVRIMIVLQTLAIVFIVWLTSRLGINPVLKAVDKIKEDSPIPEVGANEFRYLAKAYNKMYAQYRNSLDHLNYKASHDELTGAYNRSGYDLLLTSIDIKSTYMMLLDIDNFKTINDSYGHETGDRVLQKLVKILNHIFRDDDYICRIGGDEFVVFMVHAGGMQNKLIETKVRHINEELADTSDGVPKTSVSVGIIHGSDVDDVKHMFEKADAAMYESKKRGKRTFTFFAK